MDNTEFNRLINGQKEWRRKWEEREREEHLILLKSMRPYYKLYNMRKKKLKELLNKSIINN